MCIRPWRHNKRHSSHPHRQPQRRKKRGLCAALSSAVCNDQAAGRGSSRVPGRSFPFPPARTYMYSTVVTVHVRAALYHGTIEYCGILRPSRPWNLRACPAHAAFGHRAALAAEKSQRPRPTTHSRRRPTLPARRPALPRRAARARARARARAAREHRVAFCASSTLPRFHAYPPCLSPILPRSPSPSPSPSPSSLRTSQSILGHPLRVRPLASALSPTARTTRALTARPSASIRQVTADEPAPSSGEPLSPASVTPSPSSRTPALLPQPAPYSGESTETEPGCGRLTLPPVLAPPPPSPPSPLPLRHRHKRLPPLAIGYKATAGTIAWRDSASTGLSASLIVPL